VHFIEKVREREKVCFDRGFQTREIGLDIYKGHEQDESSKSTGEGLLTLKKRTMFFPAREGMEKLKENYRGGILPT